MADYTIRNLRGLTDAQAQYELWLRATETLPRAWRSCLRNVEHQLQQGLEYPDCRLYAERPDGTLLGYIGTHPPFEWVDTQHGPPSRSLGWATPFGFPWTAPHDAELETVLYEAMLRVTPVAYSAFRRDIYIQRIRESWTRHVAFFERHGWRRTERLPLLGREIGDAGAPPAELTPMRRADLELVSELSQVDTTGDGPVTCEDLQQRYDAGWLVADTFWRLGDRGVFALELRRQWAGVTLLLARPDAWDDTVRAAAAQAGRLGATEIYFTIEPQETRRREALERIGFSEVDAGVYYVRAAD